MSQPLSSKSLPRLEPAFRVSGEKAQPKTASKTVGTAKPSVLSIRLSNEERWQLEREAAGQTLSAYARRKLFGGGVSRRRGSGQRAPVADHKALARVMGAMGRSPAIGTLQGILRACEDEALVVGPEAEAALREACAKIEAMRLDLLEALGLRPE